MMHVIGHERESGHDIRMAGVSGGCWNERKKTYTLESALLWDRSSSNHY